MGSSKESFGGEVFRLGFERDNKYQLIEKKESISEIVLAQSLRLSKSLFSKVLIFFCFLFQQA